MRSLFRANIKNRNEGSKYETENNLNSNDDQTTKLEEAFWEQLKLETEISIDLFILCDFNARVKKKPIQFN